MRPVLLTCLFVLAPAPVVAEVYVCQKDGVKVLADRPCSSEAQRIEMTAPNTYTAAELPTPSQPAADSRSKESKVRDMEVETRRRKQERCSKLVDSLRRVQSKMRTGYTVKEGERLRERANQLTQTLRREQCH